MQKSFVSVIVPFYNDIERLRICLRALHSQSYPVDSFEIIIVDNGSTDRPPNLLADFPDVRCLEETRPGSYAARNKGIIQANGEILAFTDSDCIPNTDWIQNGVSSIQRYPNCGLLGGRIKLFFGDTEKLTSVEFYELLKAFQQEKYINEDHYAATANAFTLRIVFEKIGLFNENLTSGGDFEWGQRVFAANYDLVYADDVVVLHPARSSFAQLYKKVTRVTGKVVLRKSIMQKTKEYVRNFFPPIKVIVEGWKDPRLSTLGDKMRFTCSALFVRYVALFEHTRLLFGGKPRRS